MSAPPTNPQLADDRALVRRWFRTGATAALTVPRRPGYTPSDVLWPTRASGWRQNLRSLVVLIAGVVPAPSWKVALYRLLGAKIGRGVYISPRVCIDPLYPELITLEDGCLLGVGCRLFAHEVTAHDFRLGRVVVRAGAVMGAFATVRAGVTIGREATVGFNSFVNRDVPDGATVAGVPARPIRSGKEPH